MATPREKLARSLESLRELQEGGRRVFRSDELSRVDRERLLEHGFVRPIMKGWIMSSSPDTLPGDTTPWYASFWEFCARYASDRFGDEWHLSPEQSILLWAEDTSIPDQVVVYTPHGTNNTIELLFGTSLYDLKRDSMPPDEDLVRRGGLRLYTPAPALIRVPGAFFVRHPVEARVVLGEIGDPSDLLRKLLEGGHSTIAGRLAGAFRRAGDPGIADEILSTMRGAGYDVREQDPFDPDARIGEIGSRGAPVVRRMESLWASMRETVVETFPEAPGRPESPGDYLRRVEEIYPHDAYHSLSLEGYEVTAGLIDRVRSGAWNPEGEEAARQDRDALAARGYWETHQLVRRAVARVLGGEEPGAVARAAHRDWYRALFRPFVASGLLEAAALAGYRSDPVYIRGSRHVPPRAEAVREAMPAFFDLLEAEAESSVRAVLGHWMLGYIHPFPNGNGRLARFLMNVMLASGGYPWTVIRVEDRAGYMSALEDASVEGKIRPLAEFLAGRVRWSEERVENGPPSPR